MSPITREKEIISLSSGWIRLICWCELQKVCYFQTKCEPNVEGQARDSVAKKTELQKQGNMWDILIEFVWLSDFAKKQDTV